MRSYNLVESFAISLKTSRELHVYLLFKAGDMHPFHLSPANPGHNPSCDQNWVIRVLKLDSLNRKTFAWKLKACLYESSPEAQRRLETSMCLEAQKEQHIWILPQGPEKALSSRAALQKVLHPLVGSDDISGDVIVSSSTNHVGVDRLWMTTIRL